MSKKSAPFPAHALESELMAVEREDSTSLRGNGPEFRQPAVTFTPAGQDRFAQLFNSLFADVDAVTEQVANSSDFGDAFDEPERQQGFFEIVQARQSAFEIILRHGFGQIAEQSLGITSEVVKDFPKSDPAYETGEMCELGDIASVPLRSDRQRA